MKDNKMMLVIITVILAFVGGVLASLILPSSTSTGVYVAIGIACVAVINIVMRKNGKK